MKVLGIILVLLGVVLGVAALSKMNLDGAEGAQAAGRMVGTVLFPALFVIGGAVLWKKSGKASETM